MLPFTYHKKQTLDALHADTIDRSRKGGPDTQIIPLLNTINALDNHYTTSSCAGRFIVLGLTASKKKHTTSWLFVSHDAVLGNDIAQALQQSALDDSIVEVWFKCECPILHVCSKTMDDALWLLRVARECGLRRSGIISQKRERVITEIIGTLSFAVPLVANTTPLHTDKQYWDELAILAKQKLAQARAQFDNFTQAITQNSTT